MKIVFGPVLADRAWKIGQGLLPREMKIELLSSDEGKRIDQLKTADFYMGFRKGIKDSDYEHMGNLKLIQFLSAGYDGMNLEKLRQMKLPLANNGGANSYAVSEHAILLMMAVYRQLPALDRVVRGGGWRAPKQGEEENHELAGRTVGIVGLGMIGKMVAKRLSGFEVKLIYSDLHRASPEEEARLNVTYRPLDDLIREADVITLHAPYDKSTHHLIGERTLAMMKPDAIVVNCARGELVDEAALYKAVKEGRIFGAGLDTYDPEPPKADNPLFTLDRVVVTPHTAGPTWESWPKRFGNSFANVERVARGEKPLWVVPELRDLVA